MNMDMGMGMDMKGRFYHTAVETSRDWIMDAGAGAGAGDAP